MDIDKRKKSKIHQEIDALIERNGGTVTKEQVVEEAMNPETALHAAAKKQGLFDPEKAQRFALLTWAQTVLHTYHVYVTVENKEPIRTRAMVSLISDRGKGGYRPVVQVLSDKEKRLELLETAKRELIAFRKKFAILQELAPIFEAVDALE